MSGHQLACNAGEVPRAELAQERDVSPHLGKLPAEAFTDRDLISAYVDNHRLDRDHNPRILPRAEAVHWTEMQPPSLADLSYVTIQIRASRQTTVKKMFTNFYSYLGIGN